MTDLGLRQIQTIAVDHCALWNDRSTVGRINALLADAAKRGGDALDRTGNPNGHITCSALPVDTLGRVALIKHKTFDRWLLPGGHVEAEDSDLYAAALRELTEEMAVSPADISPVLLAPAQPIVGHPPGEKLSTARIPFDIDIHSIPANAKRGEPAHLHYDFRWLVKVDFGPLLARLGINETPALGQALPAPSAEVGGWTLTDADDPRLPFWIRYRLASPMVRQALVAGGTPHLETDTPAPGC